MSYFIGDLRIKMSYFTEDLVISFAIDSFFKTYPLFSARLYNHSPISKHWLVY